MDIPSSKRPRAPSGSSLTTSPGSSDPPHKASRIVVSSSLSHNAPSSALMSDPAVQGSSVGPLVNPRPLLCNLPPTCHHQPTPLANTNELERHYATYHAHVCAAPKCGCVFTEARLLELHHTECHDPIAAVRKERGEKIFQCHLPAPECGRNFLTPKARRLHLIQSHGYPKEYFFAVTNKGIGGLLKKWGEGASMIRKEWKPRAEAKNKNVNTTGHREGDDKMEEDDDGDDDDSDDEVEEEDDAEEEEMVYEIDGNNEDNESADLEATPRMLPRTTGIHSPESSVSSSKSNNRHPRRHNHHRTNKHTHEENTAVAGLTDSLDSLSLVPNSIRFGRGKTGGFAPNQHGARGRARGGSGGAHSSSTRGMDATHHRGTGHRGGARGGAPAISNTGTVELPSWTPKERGRGRGRGRPVPRGSWGRGRGF